MLRNLLALALVAAFATPLGGAHPAALPFEDCSGAQMPHHYVFGSTPAAYTPIGSVTWRTTVVLLDSCPYDGDGDAGIGGGFLPASHHRDYVCVADETGIPVRFTIGAVDFFGNVVRESYLWTNCGPAFDTLGPIPPGADGGWWVFIQDLVNTKTGEVSTPTAGHIWA